MNVPEVTGLVLTYAQHRGGQFTRSEFVHWGSRHGLARRAPEGIVDAAIAAALHQGLIVKVGTLPGAVHPTYKLAPDQRRTAHDPNHLDESSVAAYLGNPRQVMTDGVL